ncbi:MAG TPA: hypothetical protein H9915_03000 [Candidatus Gemmiger faecigallinarum]|nr:hypothetical protein [Candidatus Gemmiger faecigallinarum]
MKRFWKGTAVLGLALALAACAAAPADKDVAAPEFPWANGYDQTVAALEEQGAEFAADPGDETYAPNIQLDSGTLFGVEASGVVLGFTRAGELTSVSGYVDAAEKETLQNAMEDALGDPADSYQPVMFGPPRMTDTPAFGFSAAVKRIAPEDHLLWRGEQPLSRTWTEEQQAEWKASIRDPLLAAGADLTSEVGLSRNEEWGDMVYYAGEVALDAYLEYHWEKTAELILTEDVCQVRLTRVCIPMA